MASLPFRPRPFDKLGAQHERDAAPFRKSPIDLSSSGHAVTKGFRARQLQFLESTTNITYSFFRLQNSPPSFSKKLCRHIEICRRIQVHKR